MTAQALPAPRFIRKTTLSSSEYNTNFDMLDRDVIEAISSPAADKVTPLMSKIYLRLRQAPAECREATGVLRFEGEVREGKWIKAWDQLCQHLRVSSETASKALQWMHKEGIIGYSAFKNGVGIRIFLNRASSSIATRPKVKNKKILDFAPASTIKRPAALSETAFNDTFGIKDNSESYLNSHAPENGADIKMSSGKDYAGSPQPLDERAQAPFYTEKEKAESATPPPGVISVDEIVERLRSELEPCVKSAASQAAAQAAAREVARTREWFETKALPKAVRVAQSESYSLLRKHGTLTDRETRARAELQVGRNTDASPGASQPRLLTPEEIQETAETCVALMNVQGTSIELTLSEISSEGGGWLLPEDAPKVREAAHHIMLARKERR